MYESLRAIDPNNEQMSLEIQFPTTDLINALNGFSGLVFKWDSHSQCFTIADNGLCKRLLHTSDVSMAQQFLQMATDHKIIQDLISSRSTTHCPYEGAMLIGIENSLQQYHSKLNQLENDWHSLPNQPLTGFKSTFRFEDFLFQLRKLLKKINNKEITYNNLLSLLYELMDTGGEESRSSFRIIFDSMMTAVYQDIWCWMIFGYLTEESKGIFFIKDNSDANADGGDDTDVRLDGTDMPSFVDNVVALKILFTGSLIRYFCSFGLSHRIFVEKEQEFARQYALLRQKAFEKQSFAKFVESIRKEAAKFSSQYVIQEEGIVRHFMKIKDIYLTGNENVWNFFVEKIKDMSEKKYENWSESRKDKYMRSVIENILIKSYCDEDRVDAFLSDLKITFKSSTNHRLPVIGIDYRLPPLTKRIIRSHLMQKYERIFNFMLQLFLARQQLSHAWKRQMRKRRMANPEMWFIRHKLTQFMDNLTFYIKVNVFEIRMREFVAEIESSQDYEEMQLRHSSFVSLVAREMFLDYPAVEKILLQVFEFVHQNFGEDSTEVPDEAEVKKLDKELCKMMHELGLLFCALRDYRFHSSLCQLLFKMGSVVE